MPVMKQRSNTPLHQELLSVPCDGSIPLEILGTWTEG